MLLVSWKLNFIYKLLLAIIKHFIIVWFWCYSYPRGDGSYWSVKRQLGGQTREDDVYPRYLHQGPKWMGGQLLQAKWLSWYVESENKNWQNRPPLINNAWNLYVDLAMMVYSMYTLFLGYETHYMLSFNKWIVFL